MTHPTIVAIERGLKMQREQEPDRYPISGSAAGACKRELALKLLGAPQRELSARALRIFGMGHTSEELLVNARIAATGDGFECMKQAAVWTPVPVSPDLVHRVTGSESVSVEDGVVSIRSRIDLLIVSSDTADWGLEEYKSMGSFPFKKAKEQGLDDGYLAQVMFQVEGERIAMKSDPTYVRVICHDKDKSELHVIDVDWRGEKARQVLAERKAAIAEVLEAQARGELASVPGEYAHLYSNKTGKLPWQCDYCMVGPEVGQCLSRFGHEGQLVKKGDGDLDKWSFVPA